VILRIWRARLDPARIEEYRRLEAKQCLAMLRKQPGFLGVFFLREAADNAASITIWEDRGAVEALESSPSYLRATRELAEGGLLVGEPSVEVLEIESGDLRSEALVGALARTGRTGPSLPYLLLEAVLPVELGTLSTRRMLYMHRKRGCKISLVRGCKLIFVFTTSANYPSTSFGEQGNIDSIFRGAVASLQPEVRIDHAHLP
jgi:heme-degrading monooxygenase HmoA